MSTFGEMVTYVSKRLIDPTNTAITVSDVEGGINDSINYWRFRRFWFNEVADSAVLIVQDPSFPYPTNFLVPSTDDDGFYIEYGNVRYPMIKTTQQTYDALYLSNGYGLPKWYARIGDKEYKCYPIPDRAYTVGRHYLKDYPVLSADGDTNDFTDNASRLINLWALGNLTTELRQDTTMGDYYREASQNEYRQLRVMTDKSNAAGKLTIYSTLNGGGFR